jgi:small nuclear ribonucleoprotein (snRNP)-like protein
MDKQLNIILTNTEEYRLNDPSSQGRFVGMVMIPWKQITKVEVQGKDGPMDFEDDYT